LSETVDILEFDFSSAINGEKFFEFFGLITIPPPILIHQADRIFGVGDIYVNPK